MTRLQNAGAISLPPVGGPEVGPASNLGTTCSCGIAYTAEQWADLELCGHIRMHGDGPDLELRNCPCGSTRSIELTP